MGSFSIFHWLILILVFAFYALPIYIAASRVRQEKREARGITPGFKGWLFVLMWGLWLAPIIYFGNILTYYSQNDIRNAFDAFPFLMNIELLQNVVLGLCFIALLYLGMKRSALFFRGWIVLLVVVIANYPINLLMVSIALGAQGAPFDPLADGGAQDLGRWLGSVVGSSLWTAYVLRSRRAALTFVR